MGYKNTRLIITVIIFISIITVIWLYHDTIKFENVKIARLERKSKYESTNPLRKCQVVITSIHMGAGNKNSLGLVLASPYTTKEQESQLWKYSTQIKSDFILSVGEEKLREWIKNRDFRDVKITFRKIVNKYLDEPVPEVYISSFFYE